MARKFQLISCCFVLCNWDSTKYRL